MKKGIAALLCVLMIRIPVFAAELQPTDRTTDAKGNAYDYVLCGNSVYDTDDMSAYDFGFRETVEFDGLSYFLDHVEYEVVNQYESIYGEEDICHELAVTVSDITDKETYQPDKTIQDNGFTYEVADIDYVITDDGTVTMTGYIDTEIYDYNKPPKDYPQFYEYEYEENGETYELPYVDYTVLQEGWFSGFGMDGTITGYDAATYKVGQLEIVCDGTEVELSNELATAILREMGYADRYRVVAAAYSSDVYESGGGMCRNYYIDCDLYGKVYRLNYEASFDFPTYEATITYRMQQEDEDVIESLKNSYDVTAYGFYVAEKKAKTMPAAVKIAIGAGVVLALLLLIALAVYILKGGRRSTDYKSKRDAKRDYKNL